MMMMVMVLMEAVARQQSIMYFILFTLVLNPHLCRLWLASSSPLH